MNTKAKGTMGISWPMAHTMVILGVQIRALDLSPEQIAAEGAGSSEAGVWCRSFACSMGNTEKKDYVYLKTIASRKISWLIIRFPIKIAIRLGAPCAPPVTTPTCVCKLPQACEDCYLGVSTVASPKKWVRSVEVSGRGVFLSKGFASKVSDPTNLRCFCEYRK